jgi:signal recognition particle subunit SEC65
MEHEPNPAARVLDAALQVARDAPKRRGKYVSHALVYWPHIETLREALEALGVEWRAPDGV